MIDSFLRYLEFEKRYSAKTIRSYETDLTQFLTFLKANYGTADPDSANFGMIRSWIVQLSEQNLNATSINRKIACLRSFFKFLMRQGIITKDPTVKIRVLKTKKKLPQFVNEEEMAAVLDTSHGQGSENEHPWIQVRNTLIVELLYGTGMRLSELINLKDASIRVKDRTVKVLGKRNKERVIPFPKNLVSLIEEYQVLRNRVVEKSEAGHLLVTEKGQPLYPMLVQRVVKSYLNGTSLEKKSPHVIRHTFATHLLNKGAEINAVKDLLGHSSLAATQVYTHNTIDKLKKVFEQAHPKA